MNDTDFDVWTRRQLGLTAAGAVPAFFATVTGDAAAKKKRKRKRRRQEDGNERCLDLHQRCRTGDASEPCCAGLTCDETETLDGLFIQCCLPTGSTCQSGSDCCYPTSCDEVAGRSALTCCREYQATCASDGECCRDLQCSEVFGLAGNHCCAAQGASCHEDLDCCATDSTYCNPFTLLCDRVS